MAIDYAKLYQRGNAAGKANGHLRAERAAMKDAHRLEIGYGSDHTSVPISPEKIDCRNIDFSLLKGVTLIPLE